LYRCPKTGARVQGFTAEDVSEDHHSYEPVTCPGTPELEARGPHPIKKSGISAPLKGLGAVCRQIHHVNPTTGKVLGEDD